MKKIPITIVAKPSYLAVQSDPVARRFVWTYEITITNESEETVQLLNRSWLITDMSGKVEEVNGPGVIGLQPLIKAHKTFMYTSFCQLTTPQGTMAGYYEMQTLEEECFHVEIPKFILSAPSAITQTFRSYLH